MLPGDLVMIPARAGSGACQEWWHFQRTDLFSRGEDGSHTEGKWEMLLSLIGYTPEGLSEKASPALYNRCGIGYRSDILNKKAT